MCGWAGERDRNAAPLLVIPGLNRKWRAGPTEMPLVSAGGFAFFPISRGGTRLLPMAVQAQANLNWRREQALVALRGTLLRVRFVLGHVAPRLVACILPCCWHEGRVSLDAGLMSRAAASKRHRRPASAHQGRVGRCPASVSAPPDSTQTSCHATIVRKLAPCRPHPPTAALTDQPGAARRRPAPQWPAGWSAARGASEQGAKQSYGWHAQRTWEKQVKQFARRARKSASKRSPTPRR